MKNRITEQLKTFVTGLIDEKQEVPQHKIAHQ
jgi:hypothetical protein